MDVQVVAIVRLGSSKRRLRKRPALAMRDGGVQARSYSRREISMRY